MSPLRILVVCLALHFAFAIERSCLLHLLRQFCNDEQDLMPIVYVYESGYSAESLEEFGNHTFRVDRLQNEHVRYYRRIKCVVYVGSTIEIIPLRYLANSVISFRALQLILLIDNPINFSVAFFYLWREYFANVIIVVQNVAYTYFPITKGECKAYEPVKLGQCDKVVSFPKESEVRYFPNCPIYISALTVEPFLTCSTSEGIKGIQMEVLDLVAKKLGVEPRFRGYCGTSKDTSRRIAQDVYMSAHQTVSELAMPVYYISEKNSIFLLKPGAEEPWQNILRIFDGAIWACILASIVCVTITCHLLHNDGRLNSSIIFVLGVLIASVPKVPTRLKQIFIFWIVVAVLLVNSFTGLMTSYLVKTISKPRLGTLDEIAQAGFKFCGIQNDLFEKIGIRNSTTRYYIENFVYYNEKNISGCDSLFLQGGYAINRHAHLMMYVAKNANAHYKIHESITLFSNYIGFGTTWNWFYVRIYDTIQRLNEGGIIQHLDEYEWKEMNVDEIKLTALSLKHIYFIFLVCSVGQGLAFLVFLMELYSAPHKLVSRIKNRWSFRL